MTLENMTLENMGSERISDFPGDRTETSWLDTFEYLRLCLSESLGTNVQLGCYWIGDVPGAASAGGVVRVRSRSPIAGVTSDSWEGLLCWSGSRGKQGYAHTLVFPFLEGSVVQLNGRLADLGQNAEASEFLTYRFDSGRFALEGWTSEDGPGEWAGVTGPGSVYWQRLTPLAKDFTFEAREPIIITLQFPIPTAQAYFNAARISLVHVNRNSENTNLVPWTVRPPKSNSHRILKGSEAELTAPQIFQVRLDKFSIRGGWPPGNYYLSVRIQNYFDPKIWRWACDISSPIKITIR